MDFSLSIGAYHIDFRLLSHQWDHNEFVILGWGLYWPGHERRETWSWNGDDAWRQFRYHRVIDGKREGWTCQSPITKC